MNHKTAMANLRKAGSAQTRKTYARHGVNGEMYGVSYAHLGTLKKQIGHDHALALSLWDSENHDARVLACMIDDPAKATMSQINQWLRDLENHVILDAFIRFVSQTRFAEKKMLQWMKSRSEFAGAAGWGLLALMATDDERADSYFADFIPQIESHIHQQKNRVRQSMNNALIAIGIRSTNLEKLAIAAAKRIGKVEVDHGDTSCKTPDAIAYIKKSRQRKKKSRRAAC